MPKYLLPPLSTGATAPEATISVREPYSYPDEWARRITIPVNQEILDGLAISSEVEVTLRGTVEELSSNLSSSQAGRSSLTVSIAEVEAYMESTSEEVSEEEAYDENADFEKGFGNGVLGMGKGNSFFNRRGY